MSEKCFQRPNHRSGIISIMVTMIMMIVISLIVLGFAQISRRETTNSLDSQLSTQAYYAAESGINDARAVIDGLVSSGGIVQPKTSCANDVNYNFNSTISAANNVAYTCVLINPGPPQLVYSVSSTPTVVPIFPTAPLGTLNLSWAPAAGEQGSNVGNCTNPPSKLPTTSAWNCPYPMLRVDLVPTSGSLTRGGLEASTMTVFFQPMNGGAGGTADLVSSRGDVIPANCNAVSCTAKVGNVANLTNGGYLRVSSIYKNNSRLTITSSNPNAAFSNAEAFIDVTGKAQDVLRRVVVAVDLTTANSSPTAPAALVTSDSVCKRFGVGPGVFGVASSFPGDGGNPLCLDSGLPAPPGGGGGGPSPPGGGGAGGTIGGCTTLGICTPGALFPQYVVDRYIISAPPNSIVGCTWDWGDGTMQPEPPSNCQINSKGWHPYTPKYAGGKIVCMQYQIKLIWNLSGGGTIVSNIQPANVPGGTDRSCPNP